MDTVQKLQNYLASAKTYEVGGRKYRDTLPRIKCGDGTTMSVQVGTGMYCTPRDNEGPWGTVEVGFPSQKIDAIMPYIDGDENSDATDTVYGYVPIGILADAIDLRGGIAP